MAIATLADVTRHQRAERPDEIAIVLPADNRHWTYD